jgi:hypothetical protein
VCAGIGSDVARTFHGIAAAMLLKTRKANIEYSTVYQVGDLCVPLLRLSLLQLELVQQVLASNAPTPLGESESSAPENRDTYRKSKRRTAKMEQVRAK